MGGWRWRAIVAFGSTPDFSQCRQEPGREGTRYFLYKPRSFTTYNINSTTSAMTSIRSLSPANQSLSGEFLSPDDLPKVGQQMHHGTAPLPDQLRRPRTRVNLFAKPVTVASCSSLGERDTAASRKQLRLGEDSLPNPVATQNHSE